MGPKWGQDEAKRGQDGAKRGQDGAKRSQDGAKMGPKWSQHGVPENLEKKDPKISPKATPKLV